MKNKVLMGLIATATIGTAIATPAIINSQNTTKVVNKVLMVNNKSNSSTNEAVVINGNSKMSLYALSNGSGIVSNLSTGEMLTILGQAQNGYCKVKVQETGAIGYISVVNMQNILNGTNDTFTQLSGTGQVINVSSNVRLRSNPAIGNNIIGHLTNGTSHILNGTNDTFTQLSGTGQVINVSSNVRLRSNPAIGNNIIGHLTNGTSLNILGKQGQWYKVSVNGQIGFIYEEYVSTNITDSNSQSVTNNVNTNSENVSTSATSTSSSTNNTNSSNHVKNVVVRTNTDSNSQSVTNNVNTNSENVSTSATSTSSSTNNTNSSNHVKNVVVRTKSSATSNSLPNISNNKENKEIKSKSTISENELAGKMRQWILVGQYNYSKFSDLNGTVWSKQWIDNVSNKELVTAFVNANGKNSLSKNITSAELNKATMKLTSMALKQPMPFSLKQATKYINQMMEQSYPKQVVTKVVPNKGGYIVYTKQLGNKPFWYVNGYTGAATGV